MLVTAGSGQVVGEWKMHVRLGFRDETKVLWWSENSREGISAAMAARPLYLSQEPA